MRRKYLFGGLIFLVLILACSGPKPTTSVVTIPAKVWGNLADTSKPSKKGTGAPSTGDKNSRKPSGALGNDSLQASSKTGPNQKSAKKSESGPSKNEPLIMENADHLEGYRSRGEVVLTGHVRFKHGELRFTTERAVWAKDQNKVYCEQGMVVTHQGSELTADQGQYSKSANQAEASGNVKFRDSSGNLQGVGGRLTYNRISHDVVFSNRPELRRFYQDSSGVDSNQQTRSDSVHETDTLVLRSESMRYNDSTGLALAEQNVIITRRKTKITCAKAEYHEKTDSLFLMGAPVVHVDQSQIQGDKMRIKMNGEEIKGLLVLGKAEAQNLEPKTDSTPARQSKVKGDSLSIAFLRKSIDSVLVYAPAEGRYYDLDKPKLQNRMQGHRMVMRFNGKEVSSAQVTGAAHSTYYHFEKGKIKGRNVAEGDTIQFAFAKGEVDEVMVLGQSHGSYFSRSDKHRDSTSTDSTNISKKQNQRVPAGEKKQ